MSRICPNCNNVLNDTDVFCQSCGTRVPVEEQPASSAAATANTAPGAQSFEQQNFGTAPAAPAPQTSATVDESKKTVSTGEFFGLHLLFAIPIVGLICKIIFCFSPKRDTLRHYALSELIWTIIRFVLSVIITVLVIVGIGAAASSIKDNPKVNDALNEFFGNKQDGDDVPSWFDDFDEYYYGDDGDDAGEYFGDFGGFDGFDAFRDYFENFNSGSYAE